MFFSRPPCCGSACDDDGDDGAPTNPLPGSTLSFFVTSSKSTTGNLGGLSGADRRCQDLAAAVGFGQQDLARLLERGAAIPPTGQAVDARTRIGNGPWFNANGAMVAQDLSELHARRGDAQVFVDERNQHDRRAMARVAAARRARHPHRLHRGRPVDARDDVRRLDVGVRRVSPRRSGTRDGLGPNASSAGTLSSWNSSHANQSCAGHGAARRRAAASTASRRTEGARR